MHYRARSATRQEVRSALLEHQQTDIACVVKMHGRVAYTPRHEKLAPWTYIMSCGVTTVSKYEVHLLLHQAKVRYIEHAPAEGEKRSYRAAASPSKASTRCPPLEVSTSTPEDKVCKTQFSAPHSGIPTALFCECSPPVERRHIYKLSVQSTPYIKT